VTHTQNVYQIGGGWGYHINWWDVDRLRVHGHYDPIPVVGDRLRARMASGRTGIYEFIEIAAMRDPKDQFFATVRGLGYAGEV